MRDYYNEFDPHAAQWLRNLIEAGLLPTGDVDERDVRDVAPSDLVGYRRCHFFAGIGIWAYALERAGFEGECWTGSCPCQPFSAAGKGDGFDDERHLWPDWFWLISQCRPRIVFGEQVSGKDALPWFDLVSDDLEGVGYSVGAVDTPAASVGAPHIRQRLYWLAHAGSERRQQIGGSASCDEGAHGRRAERNHIAPSDEQDQRLAHAPSLRPSPGDGELGGTQDEGRLREPAGTRQPDGLAYPVSQRGRGRESGRTDAADAREPEQADGLARSPSLGRGRRGDGDDPRSCGEVQAQGRSPVDGLGNPQEAKREHNPGGPRAGGNGFADDGSDERLGDAACEQELAPSAGGLHAELGGRGAVNGVFADARWVYCTDGYWRPVGPRALALADGAAGRVGRLRAYGNGLCAPQAEEFVRAAMEAM